MRCRSRRLLRVSRYPEQVDIAEFLTARLDEAELMAAEMRDNARGMADCGEPHGSGVETRHGDITPEWVLADVAAKRAILANAEWGWSDDQGCDASWYALRAVAQVYADHPDFDPAWVMTADAP